MMTHKFKMSAVAVLFAIFALPVSTASAYTTCTQNGPFVSCHGSNGSVHYRSNGIQRPNYFQNRETWNYQGRQLRAETNCFGGHCTTRFRY